MIELSNTTINAEVKDILNLLKHQISEHYFKDIRQSSQSVMTNCPFHKGGQEKHPSFGINEKTGVCHCFACGWAGTLDRMISEIFGRIDSGEYGLNWLKKNFNSVEIEVRKDLNINLDRKTRWEEIPQKDYLNYVKQRLKYNCRYGWDRDIMLETQERFYLGYDKEKDEVTIPVGDINGNCIFVARRSIKGKRFTLPKDIVKPVYLANKIIDDDGKSVYVCEGPIDALTIGDIGKPAVALFGTGTYDQYKILSKLPVREYILAFDPDEAGRKATERFRKFVKNKIIREVVYENAKQDVNDLKGKFLDLQTTL